jgi:hypothetical protein
LHRPFLSWIDNGSFKHRLLIYICMNKLLFIIPVFARKIKWRVQRVNHGRIECRPDNVLGGLKIAESSLFPSYLKSSQYALSHTSHADAADEQWLAVSSSHSSCSSYSRDVRSAQEATALLAQERSLNPA